MLKSSSPAAAIRGDIPPSDGEEKAERVQPVARPAAPPPNRPQPVAPNSTVTPRPDGKPSAGKGRSRLRLVLMLGGIFGLLIAGGDFWLRGGRYVSSDDSYLQAPKLMVSTDISGIVTSVEVHQGQQVKAGDVLFRVDPAQYRIALDAARANLAQIKLSLEAAKQDYLRIQSDIGAQQARIALAQANFDRTASLIKTAAETRANYDQTRYTLEAAQKTLASLNQQAEEALTKLGGNANLNVEQHPQYLQAKAQVDEAQREFDHTVVRAPFAGIVTEVDALQPGTYLVAQTAALTNTGAIGLVGTDQMWVDSNIKETDLAYVKVGDPVDVTIDAYPNYTWHGKVASIYPASGSEFSILPAQNSSGNWVKVVQRIPVRIDLERRADDPALRIGMTAAVSIDTGHQRKLSDLWGGGNAAPASAPQDEAHDTNG
jgi:membrane fusion protein (multidrug efflux system)